MKNLIVLSLALFSVFSLTAQNQADLKYNLEIQKSYRVKNTSVQNTTQTVQGMQQSVQTNNSVVLSLKPLKNIEGAFIAEVRFDTIITLVSMPPMEINSSRPGDLNSSDISKVMECIMNRLSNSTFLVKFAGTGHVIEIMNLETASAGILQGIDSVQGPMAEIIKTQAKNMVQPGAIKSMIESVTAYLPGKEIKKDEKWETNLLISSGGMDMNVSSAFLLSAIDGNQAKIAGDLVIESGRKPMNMHGAEIIPDIRGVGKSEITVDTSTGWVIKGTSKQQMKGEMSVNAQGMSMQIPIEINSDSEIVALP
ncbi:MAG: hypothetical protein JXB34_06310 [Bacteroidales bacterium]|nr:hypothetical protein [Bacteroidales bacterium]